MEAAICVSVAQDTVMYFLPCSLRSSSISWALVMGELTDENEDDDVVVEAAAVVV